MPDQPENIVPVTAYARTAAEYFSADGTHEISLILPLIFRFTPSCQSRNSCPKKIVSRPPNPITNISPRTHVPIETATESCAIMRVRAVIGVTKFCSILIPQRMISSRLVKVSLQRLLPHYTYEFS